MNLPCYLFLDQQTEGERANREQGVLSRIQRQMSILYILAHTPQRLAQRLYNWILVR